MATPKTFNTTVYELIQDLCTALPNHSELQMAKTLSEAFLKMQPDTPLLANKFWEIAEGRQDAIEKQDVDTLLSTLSAIVPRPNMIRSVWQELSKDNQQVVFRYLSTLYHDAESIHNHPSVGELQASSTPGGNGGLFLVYNNMWKEFLGHLAKSETEDTMGQAIKETYDRLEGLMDAKGIDCSAVHALLAPAMTKVLPTTSDFTEADMMAQMIPPTDPIAALHDDAERLGGERFKVSRTMTFAELLEAVAGSGDLQQLSMYWHYLKLITYTLQSCPPHLLSVMSDLAKNIAQNMTA